MNNTTTTKEEDIGIMAEKYASKKWDEGFFQSKQEVAADFIEGYKAALSNKEESKEEVSLDDAFKKWSNDPHKPEQDFFGYLREHYTLIKK
jgi:hypothetical protein